MKVGDTSYVKRLLEAYDDVNAKDTNGYTALMNASKNGQAYIVNRLLKAKADVNAKSTDYGYTALILASERGHTPVVKLLLEAKADVNATYSGGLTALDFAIREGNETPLNYVCLLAT